MRLRNTKATPGREEHPIAAVMKAGCQRAAQAFSAFVRQEVGSEIQFLTTVAAAQADLISYPTDNATLVITDIIGEAGGRSYLVLSAAEGALIQNLCLPSMSNAEQRATLSEAVLKELDNVLSAAMITEFSNALHLSIYGGVPHLLTLSVDDLKKKFHEDFHTESDSHCWWVKVRFIFKSKDYLQPQFVWKLPIEFLQHAEKQTFRSGK